MANVFNTTMDIKVRYDLKGSKLGRATRKDPEDQVDPEIALKDLDWESDGAKLSVDEDVKKALIK